jgi:hypothetical protein
MGWGWRLKDGSNLPPRSIYLSDGKAIQQDVLAEALSSRLFNTRRLMFVSAAGTGKTPIATEAMVRLIADELEDGKYLLYLVPFKPLQRSVVAMFSKLQYVLPDGKALRPVALYGRSEFKCPYWLAEYKYLNASNCVRQSCTLYLPPVRVKPDLTDLVLVAKWWFWHLYGIRREVLESSPRTRIMLDNAVARGNAVLCPYLAQYVDLDESITDPRILITNYDKFIKDYVLHRIIPSMIAGLIIDEADNFFARFAPTILDVGDLKVLRMQLKKLVESTKDDDLEAAYAELSDAIHALESEDIDEVKILTSLNRFVRHVYESESADESLISDVASIINMLPNDMVEYNVVKTKSGEVLLMPTRLKFLDDFRDIPILAISATMNYLPFRALGLHREFIVEFGQQKSPGRVILWLLDNARALIGWYIRKHVTRNIQYKQLMMNALSEVSPVLEKMSSINVGFAFAAIYAKIAEEVAFGKVYADIVGRSLDAAIAALKSGKLVVSTRFMRGINLLDLIDVDTRVIFTFIPKFPRPPPESPELLYYRDMLMRGVVFPSYMLRRIYNRDYLVDAWDISMEKALADLYQAIGRGLRGEDYTVIIASTDVETYGAVAMLADAGFINKPLLAYQGIIVEPTDTEWSYLREVFYNNKLNQAAMERAYEKLKESIRKKLEQNDQPMKLLDLAPRKGEAIEQR